MGETSEAPQPTEDVVTHPDTAAIEADKKEGSNGEKVTKEERAFRQFKETAEKNGIKLIRTGISLVLPFSVLSTDISPNPFLIGADPRTGVIQIGGGDKDIVGEIIRERIKMTPDQLQEIEKSIAAYNEKQPIERKQYMHEDIRRFIDIRGLLPAAKKTEFVIWDANEGRFRTSAVKSTPKQTIVDTAMARNAMEFKRLASHHPPTT